MNPQSPQDETRTIVISHSTADGVASLAGLFAHPLIRVHACGNGVEVVARARELRPTLVVIDTGLPMMDGFEVFRALRGELEALKTRLILVSDKAEQGALALARDCGVYACFRAPYSPGRLRDRVLEALGLPAEPRSTRSRQSAPTPPPVQLTPTPPPAPRLPIPTPGPFVLPIPTPASPPPPAPSPSTKRGSARVPSPAPLPVPSPAPAPLPVPVRAPDPDATQLQAPALPVPRAPQPAPPPTQPATPATQPATPPAKQQQQEMVSPVPLLKVRPRP